MRYLDLHGEHLSRIGLGTWQFGSREWGYGKDYDTREAAAIVRRALDLGITVFDTAEVYGRGRSVQILGAAIGDVEAFVATKFFPLIPTPGNVVRHAQRSIERLGRSPLDLYQIHWPHPQAPLSWSMAGLRRLLDEGLIRHAGVSNFGLRRWLRAERILGRPVLSNQVQFSLVKRRPADLLIPHAAANQRVVIACSPLAQGLLSGSYAPDRRPEGFRRRNPANPLSSTRRLAAATPLIGALREIGEAHDATPAQVALAWVIRHPNVVAIPGARTVEQLERNAAAADLTLTAEEHSHLTEVARLNLG